MKKIQEHEYAFDIKLFAVVRVTATNEAEARKIVGEVLNCAELNWAENDVRVTEASLATDDDEPELIEVDGEMQEGV